MKHAMLLAGCILLSSVAADVTGHDLTYRKTVGQDTILTRWQLYPEDSLLVRTYQEGEQLHTTWYHGDEAVRFELDDPTQTTHVLVERKGDELAVTGHQRGKKICKSLDLDGQPWLQSMSYSLGQFVLTGQQECTYAIFRIDALKSCTLQAHVVGTESLPIGGTTEVAIRVYVSATGILAKLWHCTYWFRSSDGLFLRYHGVNGLPGTPATTIELMRK